MSRYHSPKEYLDAARSPAASPAELRELARSCYPFVVVAVARHPHTEPETLAALAPTQILSRHDQELAAAIAQHPHAPPEVLAMLAERLVPVLDNGRGHHWGFAAGVAVCCHPKTPIDAIADLLRSEKVSRTFRYVVARETRRREVLDMLLSDRSEKVRKRARRTIEALDAQAES